TSQPPAGPTWCCCASRRPITEEAMRMAAPHLAAGATVVSLQTGVDNVERIRAAVGLDAMPAVVYVAAQMTAPGRVKHNGRGDLVVPVSDRGAHVSSLFEAAGVPCRLSEDIAVDLWTKMIMNGVYNALSALTH